MPSLRIQMLHLRQDGFTLDIAGWEAHGGQVSLLAGPNGAGKTTMLEAALAIRPSERRQVLLDGVDPASNRRLVAYVPTDLEFFPSSKPEHLEAFYRALYPGFHRKRFRDLARSWKVPFGRPIKTLSMGEKRRLYLALALATDAKVLFLDEPLANLDPDLAYTLADDLFNLAREKGLLLWVSTNVLEPFWGRFGKLDLIAAGNFVRSVTPTECEERAPRALWQEVFP